MSWMGTKEKQRREGRREEAEVARIQNERNLETDEIGREISSIRK